MACLALGDESQWPVWNQPKKRGDRLNPAAVSHALTDAMTCVYPWQMAYLPSHHQVFIVFIHQIGTISGQPA
jgi:hypothetical protein